jgi:glutathione S-transferase
MKLYYAYGTCAFAAHIILRETNLSADLVRVDLATHKTAEGADYYGINPKGSVPLLELDSGEHLSEGPVIVQYLCDKAGRTDLMPAAGTLPRYRVLEWQNYITSELHKSFSPLFSPDYDAATKALFSKALRKKFSWVSEQLDGQEYLTGATFTGADAYLYTVTNWSKAVKLDLSDLAPLQAFMTRVAVRPAVQEALKEERQKK